MATISLQSCGRCGDPTISRRIGRALCELLDEIEMWIQKQFSLPAKPRGFHLITREVLEQIPEIKQLRVGLLHLFILHTSASLTINENADPDVRTDMETVFNHLAPERGLPLVHTIEAQTTCRRMSKRPCWVRQPAFQLQAGSLHLGPGKEFTFANIAIMVVHGALVATITGE